jgi:ATP-binding cassette subfamily F protein uup
MTLLLNCQDVSQAYGSRVLFKNLSLSLFENEKIGLIGPNGAGKSTFLKILAGQMTPDSGECAYRKGTLVGYVPQINEFEDDYPAQILEKALQASFIPEFEKQQQAQVWLSKLQFGAHAQIKAPFLSGGWKKRLALAQALIAKPDVLLLDEPTNHLDLEGVLWLEKFLLKEAPTLIVISHDRYLLDKIATRVVEINPLYPKGLFSIQGDYQQFLEKKEQFIEGQIEQERAVKGMAKKELDWVRRSPKARTTKSQARVDAAQELFSTHADLKKRNQTVRADLAFQASLRQTRKLVVMKNLKMQIKERCLFAHLDLTLSPSTRVGLIGPNGCGKTTLLKVVAQQLEPFEGTIKYADDLKIVYFDQFRNQLPLTITLREALSPTGDYVTYLGQAIHVNGWCKRFLFSPDALDRPISSLSGGERARIAIARLMLQPADILLLDEPTNDLDIDTLETLEQTLCDFPGAIVLITHDRALMSGVCNTFIVFDGKGHTEQVAEYSQWENAILKEQSRAPIAEKKIEKPAPKKSAGLSYKQKKELESLEADITKLEEQIKELSHQIETKVPADQTQAACQQLGVLQQNLEGKLQRWEELSLLA